MEYPQIKMAAMRTKDIEFEKVADSVFRSGRRLLNPACPEGPLSKRDFHFMFQDVYSICNGRNQKDASPPMDERLHAQTIEFFKTHVESLAKQLGNTSQLSLLAVYRNLFVDFYFGSKAFNDAFRSLNEAFKNHHRAHNEFDIVSKEPKKLEVLAIAFSAWKEHLFLPLSERLQECFLSEIRKDRESEESNLFHCQAVAESLVKVALYEPDQLEFYKTHFEQLVLKDTCSFYEHESLMFLDANGVSAYLGKAEARLEGEALLAKKVLHLSSHRVLEQTCEKELITRHKDALLAECQKFLSLNQTEQLGRLYRLLLRVDLLAPMMATLESFIVATGTSMLAPLLPDPSAGPAIDVNTTSFVEAINSIHTQFGGLIAEQFAKDALFLRVLDTALHAIVNDKRGLKNFSCSELLARYTDSILKKSSKAVSEDDVEPRLNEIILVFRYLDDKDVYQKFYSKSLAKRLISATSVSDDMENQMIGKLKQVCGYEYTTKLQRMFTDISLSHDLSRQFEPNKNVPFSCNIRVLQHGAWPLGTTAATDAALPPELIPCVKAFEAFYTSKHTGRKLTWLHQLGSADLRANFGGKLYEINVTGFQLHVLLLFNANKSIPWTSLQEGLGLPDKELERALGPLLAAKILLSSHPDAPIDKDHVFTFNDEFNNKKRKIKITGSSQQKEEKSQEIQKTMADVDDERHHYLQAVTVRIMKTRKKSHYNTLVEDIISQSGERFKPTIAQIKRCIEELIDREYLERKEGDKLMLYYLA